MIIPRLRTPVAFALLWLATACSDHVPTVTLTAVDVPDPSLRPKAWIGDAGVIAAIVTPPLVLARVPTRDTLGRLLPTSELVHPSVACASVKRFQCFMMMTPYPVSDGKLENASVLVGVDTITWMEPSQTVNPIVAKTPRGWTNNSDPDLNWDVASHRWFFTNRLASNDSNVVSVFGSGDGAHFGAPRRTIAVPSHQVISQSFTVGHDAQPRLYSVRATSCGDDGATVEVRFPVGAASRHEDIEWGAPQTVSLDQPSYVPWHLEIRWVRKLQMYVGLVVAHPVGGTCGDDDLFLVVSSDGMHFNTYPHPILWRRNPWITFKAVYRSSFIYDDSQRLLRLWISGYTADYHWRLMYASIPGTACLPGLKRWPRSRVSPTATNISSGLHRGLAPAAPR
ncbi:MAG TPA: hypothetical protein VF483_08125 [Gemmatimonadaceae bacterium]